MALSLEWLRPENFTVTSDVAVGVLRSSSTFACGKLLPIFVVTSCFSWFTVCVCFDRLTYLSCGIQSGFCCFRQDVSRRLQQQLIDFEERETKAKKEARRVANANTLAEVHQLQSKQNPDLQVSAWLGKCLD